MSNSNKTNKLFDKKVKTRRTIKQRLRSLDGLSWFFIVVMTTVIISMGMLVINLQEKAAEAPTGDEYYDDLLNFTLSIPHDWQAAKPDEHHVKEVVREVTGGILFDMRLHSLTDELVPLALIVPPEKDSKDPFAKFMTLAFRGSDDEYTYLDDKIKLMDDLRALLKGMEHTDIKIKEARDINKGKMFGTVIEATATLKDQKVHYTQYLEPAGANIMIVTYGSTIKADGVKDITKMLETLIFHEGGEFLPTPLQEQMIEETKKQDELDAQNSQGTGTGTPSATPTTPITPWGAPVSKDATPKTETDNK